MTKNKDQELEKIKEAYEEAREKILDVAHTVKDRLNPPQFITVLIDMAVAIAYTSAPTPKEAKTFLLQTIELFDNIRTKERKE